MIEICDTVDASMLVSIFGYMYVRVITCMYIYIYVRKMDTYVYIL